MLIPSIDLKGGQRGAAHPGRAAGHRLATTSTGGSLEVSRAFRACRSSTSTPPWAPATNDAHRAVQRVASRGCRAASAAEHSHPSNAPARCSDYGARAVIVGSSLFRDGQARPRLRARRSPPRSVPSDVIAAVDSKGWTGRHSSGWTRGDPADRGRGGARALEPYCSEFLYTHVDREGLMTGHRHGSHPGGPAPRPHRRGHGSGRHHDATPRSNEPRRRRHRRRRRHGHLHRRAWRSTRPPRTTPHDPSAGIRTPTLHTPGSSRTSGRRSLTCSIRSRVSASSIWGAATAL